MCFDNCINSFSKLGNIVRAVISQGPIKHLIMSQNCEIRCNTSFEMIVEAAVISQRPVKDCTIFEMCEILRHVSRKF